ETPPQLLAADPPVGATEVRPSSLRLTFDEYVKAGSWRQQLLVSPPLDGAVDLVVRGKEVELTWDGDLRDNTTYVVQFGEGVVDVNEGNSAVNLVHAFSTGPQLDTLKVQGTVVDALDGSPSKFQRVLLYPSTWPVDSVLAGVAPQYVGATDEEGRFEVAYLPAGSFRLLVLEDANRNYTWDEGERAAVGPERAQAGDSAVYVMRAGSTAAPPSPYLSESVRDSSGWARWKMSEPFAPGDSVSWAGTEAAQLMKPSGDAVRAFGWNEASDSAAVQLVWHRAPEWPKGAWRTDTVDVPRPRIRPGEKAALTSKPMGKQLPGRMPELAWSAPISSVDTALCRLEVDSTEIACPVSAPWPSDRFELAAPELQRAGSEVRLTMLPGALKRAGKEGAVVPEDTLELVWSVHPVEALSEWGLTLEGVGCRGLLELVNARGERQDVVYVASDTTVRWRGLLPGKHRAIWWGDLDGDEVWRDVDVESWREPEPVTRSEPVELRANWVVETTWRLDSTACGLRPVR
ncbi:MAG: Ig-like domain-containing protein, partial [Flavobacteriales bacterium]